MCAALLQSAGIYLFSFPSFVVLQPATGQLDVNSWSVCFNLNLHTGVAHFTLLIFQQ